MIPELDIKETLGKTLANEFTDSLAGLTNEEIQVYLSENKELNYSQSQETLDPFPGQSVPLFFNDGSMVTISGWECPDEIPKMVAGLGNIEPEATSQEVKEIFLDYQAKLLANSQNPGSVDFLA